MCIPKNVTQSCIYKLSFYHLWGMNYYTLEPFPSLILNCETSWFQYELYRLIIDHPSSSLMGSNNYYHDDGLQRLHLGPGATRVWTNFYIWANISAIQMGSINCPVGEPDSNCRWVMMAKTLLHKPHLNRYNWKSCSCLVMLAIWFYGWPRKLVSHLAHHFGPDCKIPTTMG